MSHTIQMSELTGILLEKLAGKGGALKFKIDPKKWMGRAAWIGAGAAANDAYQSYRVGDQVRRAQNQ
jgi:hypothetical protein